MNARYRRRAVNQDGAAAVEFALVVPLLLTLLFAIIEFGTAYNAQILVTNAAREAARTIAVDEDATAAIATDAAEAAVEPIAGQFDDFTVSFGPSPATTGRACPPGTRITVTAVADRPLLSGFLGLEPFKLTGKATRLCAG